ncbi:hypothetical protein Gpo141_00003561 [Globisporangium polare]
MGMTCFSRAAGVERAWNAKYGNLTGIWLQMGLMIMSVLVVPVFTWYWRVGIRLYFQSMGTMAQTTAVDTTSIGVAITASYFLIYGCFGWEGMGSDGSPLPTAIASWSQPIALISY